jgi:hypothetical protein
VAGNVGYSAWIDGGGPNGGRVDVTRLDAPEPKIAYSFKLPHGGIHGAGVAGGKVFFAPKEGVAWTIVDASVALKPEAVATHALPLGNDPAGKPRRTGAFAAVQDHVLCVTGKGDDATLCVIDARAAAPTMTTLAVPGGEGNAPLTPEIVRTQAGRLIGLLFHNHPANVQAQDRLTIVDLDPNKDGSLADATIVKRLDVGASKVEGHFGHHGVDFDADGGFAFFVNPGAGTLTVLSLDDFTPRQEFTLGGVPSNIVVAGGRKVH